MISTHWFTNGTLIMGNAQPHMIYDMYGFPRELYQIQYPAPGAPALVEDVLHLLVRNSRSLTSAPLSPHARIDTSWGFDHGGWSVLVHLFPEADILVLQLSVDYAATPAAKFAIGQALKPLRDQGVLIIGSGKIVHNLGRVRFDLEGGMPWAVEFDTAINYHLAAWAQKAKLEARQIETRAINLDKLEQSVESIRDMTTLEPGKFFDDLVRLFAGVGVALVCLPHIDGSFLHGASFYDGDRIVMGLTLRGKDADRFWFSLFHELCHVLRGHIAEQNESRKEYENEADTFARDILIPQDEYQIYIGNMTFNRETIKAFANQIRIAPGIVLGRLQNDNFITYDKFNDLKDKYEFVA